MLELVLSAFQNLRANKLRSMLTMLGIIIGISSVITIVSLGQGAKMQVMGEFDKIGQNVINVEKKSSGMMGMTFLGSSDETIFTREDGEMLKRKFPEITDVIMYSSNMGTSKYEQKSKMVSALAVSSAYPDLAGTEMLTGRFFSESEESSGKYVAVIDKIAATKLFNSPSNALGKKIQLTVGTTTSTFTVIGVSPSEGGDLMASFEDQMPGSVLIPLTLASRCIETEYISQLSLMLENMDNAKELGSKVVRVLEKAHRVDDAYMAKEGFQQVAMLDSVLSTLTMAIGAIAAISLLVGGIGVMNIMLVSVTERTREIGIRKALGATRKNIKTQFLLESVILCLIGGILGITFGITVGTLLGMLVGVKAQLSLSVIILAFVFSTAVGIFFGLYPSNKAAKLDPIEALRYE